MIHIIIFYAFLSWIGLPRTEPSERWLVELEATQPGCLKAWWQEEGLERAGLLLKKLPVDNWWVVAIPAGHSTALKNLDCVIRIYEDRKINWRDTEPNDPAYINQRDMDLIGMPDAWDIATGGFTAQGDEIVVAVLDDGFQTDHPDLAANVWVNQDEIPGDGIDNDNNNYTDDYKGMNVTTGDDAHPIRKHGTQVAGVIGARGNNGIGVTGVNWRVKLMLISGGNFESELIEAYEYVLAMRKKYRATGGTSGAFVVATNLSGGLDFAKPEDHPLWCDMYNKLGQEGILSVTAAPNEPISVDEEGDMPTRCTSSYMIAVTNVDLSDVLLENAGFGSMSIDLGAPGHGTINIAHNNQYVEFTGTSAAAPHVTGTIALMYSTPCSTFLRNLDMNPSAVALMIKDIILSTGTDNASLEGITLTGKRLQTDAALLETISDCGNENRPAVKIHTLQPNPSLDGMVRAYFEVNSDTSQVMFDFYTTSGALVSSNLVSQEEFLQGYIDLDTGGLSSGVYLLTIRHGKDKDTVKVFVK